MTPIYWTPRLVEAHLAEAAATMRRLPKPRVGGYFNTWPEVVQVTRALDEPDDGPTRLGPASPQAVTHMEATLPWLRWLEPPVQKIVWARANEQRWKRIAHTYNIDRTTAWRWWTSGLVTIAAHLNAQSGATTLQHHRMQHFERDRVE